MMWKETGKTNTARLGKWKFSLFV